MTAPGAGPHCARCAAARVGADPANYHPGQVPLESEVLKEDHAALLAVLERCDGMPELVSAALADAKGTSDHLEGLDRLLSALVECEMLPGTVARAFKTACIHFGLPDWAGRFKEVQHGR